MTNASSYGNQSYENRSNRRRHGLGWVPWVALALLGAIILGSYLITRNATDTGDQSGLDLTNDPSAQAGSGAAQGTNAARIGVFSANGTDVLSAGSNASTLAGQTATANNVTVRSVVSDEGFWISSNGTQQLFVQLTPQARGGSTAESAQQVRAGQQVNVSGTLARTPADVSTLGVNASEGAAQLRTAGIYLNATSFSIR